MANEPDIIDTPVGLTSVLISSRKYEVVEGSVGLRSINISTNKNQFIESQQGLKAIVISIAYRGESKIVVHL